MRTDPNTDAIERLAYAGGRLTRARRLIARTATQLDGAFTVDTLAERVRVTDAAAGANATVYRAVAAMESAGFLTRVGTRGGHTLFAHCSTRGHHHHIVCEACGRIAHADCPLTQAIEASDAQGFRITRHEVTMYGLCPECAARTGS